MKIADTLNKEYLSIKLYKYIASFVLTAIMGLFIVVTGDSMAFAGDKYLVAVVFSLIYFLAMIILSTIKDIELFPYLCLGAGLAALVYARVGMLSFISLDYYNFIEKWLASMHVMSFKSALTTEIGDYNLPYLYFLAVLSRFSKGWMIVVKAFSCVFDVILAYYVLKFAQLKIKNTKILALVFVLTLAIPTVFLNSACWAQCDVIYSTFCVASLYYAFTKKGTASMIMFALAFSFKLQAIFIIPILLICFIIGYIDWYKLIIVPLVYVVMMFPAMLCGRGLAESLFIYFRQASQTQYKQMTLNASSVWTLMPNISYDDFKWAGIMLAGLSAVFLLYLFYIYKDRIGVYELLLGAYLSAVLLPFFLPSMHDRYFFIADILSVCIFLFNTKRWYVPLVTIFASFTTYAIFLCNDLTIFDLKPYTIALMVVIIIMTLELINSLKNKKPVTESIELNVTQENVIEDNIAQSNTAEE